MLMQALWSTTGQTGFLNFTADIEWNGSKISSERIISLHYFDEPIEFTGKTSHSILSKTLQYIKSQKDGEYLLLTYLSDRDAINQVFLKLNTCESLERFLYKRSQRKPILFVLNPYGGTKAASKLYERLIKPLLILCSMPYELIETSHSKHAISIAHDLNTEKYSGIVCISGDGVFHEIINGLFTRKDWKTSSNIPIGIIGAGTGNAISQNLNFCTPESAFLAVLNGKTTPLDIFSYHQPNHGTHFSHLSVSWGLIADLDIESESYRWLGSERFTVAALIRLIKFRTYSGQLYILPFDSNSKSIDLDRINEIPKDYKNWPIRVDDNFKMFLASNYAWLSKDFKVSKTETLNSGSMHLIWSNKLSTLQGLSVLLNPNDGDWINRPGISNINAKSFVLEPGSFVTGKCSPPSTTGILNVSGEVVPYEAIFVTIHSGLANVFCK